METVPNKWAWVDLEWPLAGGIAEYPTVLARDSLAALLSERGQTVEPVSAYDVLTGRTVKYPVWLFSAVTCDWPQCRRVASVVRRRDPEAILVVGGYHVSAMPDDEGVELFDYVVVGEGEGVVQDIVERTRCQRRGMERSEKRPTNLWSPRCQRLDDLPWPIRHRQDSTSSKLNGLMYPPPSSQQAIAALLSSRGCNTRCSFCASHTIWGAQLITRSVPSVIKEVVHVTRALETGCLVFVDQAFGENVMWTQSLCSRLHEARVQANWYCMAKPTLSKDLLPIMSVAGCTKIGFGVETADLHMRTYLKRPGIGDLDDFNRLFRACNEAGIFVKVYFMIGFPWETADYLLRTTTRFLENLEANELKITFFTPFPGTDDWTKYSGELITRDWEYFDTMSMPVVRNSRIAVRRYSEIRQMLFQAFYGSRIYAETARRLLSIRPHYVQSYIEFAHSLKASGMISGSESWLRSLKPSKRTTLVTEVA